MDFEVVKPNTPQLKAVIKLADTNKKSLGLFPRGAFEDHAARKNILAALSSAGDLQGYLLYRVVRGSEIVVIVHLCIDPKFRGTGIARALIGRLHQDTAHLRGVRLRCRNDFKAHSMWPKLGFAALRELKGRGKDGKALTEWWHDYGHATLFDGQHAVLEATREIRVVIDANIYFDLTSDRLQGKETRALQADWIGAVSKIVWLATPELQEELARPGNTTKHDYTVIRPNADAFARVLPDVLETLHATRSEMSLSPRRRSDARQIAHAIAAGETCYLTRDGEVLGKAATLRDRFSIDVLHPVELIERLDRLHEGQKYVPVLLHDRQLRMTSLAAADIDSAADRFLTPNERKGPLVACLRSLISEPKVSELQIVLDGTEPIALIGSRRKTIDLLQIPLLRVIRKGFAGDALARHMLWRIVEKAVATKTPIVEFSDTAVEHRALLVESDFMQAGEAWWRFQVEGILQPGELETKLRQLSRVVPAVAAPLIAVLADQVNHILDARAASRIDRLLWPVLVSGRGVPACLVPIRPHWAKELFDHRLARGYLFNPASHLLLNTENVYYSAASRPPALRAGARLLWYVSASSSELRAMSICDEVREDTGKVLFREFHNLGIYGWAQIRPMIEHPITKKITEKKIMAIRFSHTRLFDPPVPLKSLRATYKTRTGKKLPVQFPLGIDEATLQDILAGKAVAND